MLYAHALNHTLAKGHNKTDGQAVIKSAMSIDTMVVGKCVMSRECGILTGLWGFASVICFNFIPSTTIHHLTGVHLFFTGFTRLWLDSILLKWNLLLLNWIHLFDWIQDNIDWIHLCLSGINFFLTGVQITLTGSTSPWLDPLLLDWISLLLDNMHFFLRGSFTKFYFSFTESTSPWLYSASPWLDSTSSWLDSTSFWLDPSLPKLDLR